MSTNALEELLARATELEVKAADDGSAEPPADSLEEQVVALAAAVELLLTTSAPGEDAATDAEAELGDELAGPPAPAPDVSPLEVDDFDPTLVPDEGKAAGFGPCPGCGSVEVDVFADGTAACEDCGLALTGTEVKGGFDFVDDDTVLVEPPESKADDDLEVKGGLSEFELLRARRSRLD